MSVTSARSRKKWDKLRKQNKLINDIKNKASFLSITEKGIV